MAAIPFFFLGGVGAGIYLYKKTLENLNVDGVTNIYLTLPKNDQYNTLPTSEHRTQKQNFFRAIMRGAIEHTMPNVDRPWEYKVLPGRNGKYYSSYLHK